jgi:hypothetical protein
MGVIPSMMRSSSLMVNEPRVTEIGSPMLVGFFEPATGGILTWGIVPSNRSLLGP